MPSDFLQGLLFRLALSYHAFTDDFGWRRQKEMHRKGKMIGGSLIFTVQVSIAILFEISC
jgi:hypothetical protein